MARTKPYTQRRFPDYENLTAAQKQRIARRANREAANREARMVEKSCKVYAERGITLAGLPEESQIPNMIDYHNWHHFIREPPQYDEQLVRDFYRDMVPGAFADQCLITVRGVQVEITPELINAYHGTPDRRELDIHYGISNPPEFRATFSPVIASSLRRDGAENWDTGIRAIFKNQLHYDMAFMLLFIKTSLRPSTHTTTVDSDVARILYSLQHNHPMDVGHLMWLEILDAGNSLDGVLPFPCMITHFCATAQIRTSALRSSMRSFNITNYNTQIRTAETREGRSERQGRGVRIPAAAAERRNESLEDEDDEQVAPALPRDTPAWGRALFRQMVAGNEANRVAMEGMHDRMDSLVGVLSEIGLDMRNVAARPPRRVRRRPTDGASTSHSHPDDDE